MKIVVVDNGFVFVCDKYEETDKHATLTNARCVRVWGTSEGLGQLCSGPTKDTVLDSSIPIICVTVGRVLFTFDVSEGAWAKVL
jgi:hypothetical protein